MNEKTSNEAALDITTLDIYILLRFFINILSAQAWQYMGLRTKPGTDKIEKNHEKASVAIDCVAFIIDKLEHHILKDELDKLRSMLLDLQINFVRKKEESN